MLQEGSANIGLQKIYSFRGTERTGSQNVQLINRPRGTVLLADQVDLSGCFWMSQDGDLCILQLTRKKVSAYMIFPFPSEGACEVRDQEALGVGFLPARLLMTLVQAKLNFSLQSSSFHLCWKNVPALTSPLRSEFTIHILASTLACCMSLATQCLWVSISSCVRDKVGQVT